MIGHLREVPNAHGSLLLTVLVDKSRQALDKRFGLLPVREVAGLWDHLDPGSGYRLTPPLAISLRNDPVLRAPQQQGRQINPVQPAFEPRIVYVGLPAIKREGVSSLNDRRQFVFRELGEIDLTLCRIRPSQLQILGPGQRMHVGNIPLLPAADLDTERIYQYEMRKPRS